MRRKLPAQVQQEIAALRDFNLAYVGSESIASDRYVARGRGMSASPPEATELMQAPRTVACGMMGGDVTVTSEPGKGSVFTVRLPGSADAQARSRQPQMTAAPECS